MAKSSTPHPLNTAPLGTRFSVRYRLTDQESDGAASGPSLTDALGELIERNATHIGISTRRNGVVIIEKSRILAAKPVPPAPPRRTPGAGLPGGQ